MKKYWKKTKNDIEVQAELSEEKYDRGNNALLNLFEGGDSKGGASRRDFLKLCGFSFALTSLVSCDTKIRKAIPYIVAPVDIIPGEANYYASSYINDSDYCSILVKTRDGRPIKIEGNSKSTITQAGTNARVQASVLDLYDTNRFKNPLKDNKEISWDELDNEIISKLNKISEKEGEIVILSLSNYSPSTELVINKFIEKYPGTKFIQYDPISASGILEANKISFGKQVIPDYRFDKAELIVSFDADFLGTWLSPIEYTKQYSSKRSPDQEMSSLISFESSMSLTGSNADKRIQIKPSQEAAVLLNIYNEIAKKSIQAPNTSVDYKKVASQLLKAKRKSLVVSGSNDTNIQLLVNAINIELGNIDKTILFNSHLNLKKAIDSEMDQLVEDMNNSSVDAILINNVNPAYTYYDSEKFTAGLKKVGITVSFGTSPDETTEHITYQAPNHHLLESWNDLEPKKNSFSFCQPVIQPIFNTRQMQDSLLKWTGAESDFYETMNSLWEEKYLPMQSTFVNPIIFFDNTLKNGVFEINIDTKDDITISEDHQPIILTTAKTINKDISRIKEFEIVVKESIALGDGRHANNPWLQELPNPISKVCWDNYASLSPKQADELNLNNGDIININDFEIPAFVQAGQAYGTIGIDLGYGRKICGPVGKGIGINAYVFTQKINNNIANYSTVDAISKTGMTHALAQTQTHHTMEGREFVREADVKEYKKDPSAGNEKHLEFEKHSESLYEEREYKSHHWGMAIDLSTCTGCSNCVISCQAENNIPVVGKDEVQRVHEMHWMRIDRYYSGDENDPEVVFQPVMCQHCDNAPCENVCPVAATNQSAEGLNQMIYNRCIGTRYCNNNCPYKVRRFNWYNYTEAGTLKGNLHDVANMTLDLKRMVLNPDVTVRSQGVIEKCSMCVQRIQKAKLDAKAGKRKVLDSELETACSQSCPANSIVFGDMNDPDSEISKLIKSERKYNLLEEIYTKPSVHYLTKIRNRKS